MSNNHPLVTICVPTFNAERTLSQTLNTLVLQDYPNIKIIIVDNSSTDETISIAKNIAKRYQNITLISHNENIGGEGNFTRCINYTGGKYTAIYHSDDLYDSTIVSKQVRVLEKNIDIGAVFTKANDIDKNGNYINQRFIPKEVFSKYNGLLDFSSALKLVLRYGNIFVCPSALVRTDIYKNEIVTWDGSHYKTSADLDVWLRISKNHNLYILDENLIHYRVSDSSFSYQYSRYRTTRHDIFLVLERYLEKYHTILEEEDEFNYYMIEKKDVINRALSYILIGESKSALNLMKEEKIKYRQRLKVSTRSREIKYNFLEIIIRILAMMPLGVQGRKMLMNIKFSKLKKLIHT